MVLQSVLTVFLARSFDNIFYLFFRRMVSAAAAPRRRFTWQQPGWGAELTGCENSHSGLGKSRRTTTHTVSEKTPEYWMIYWFDSLQETMWVVCWEQTSARSGWLWPQIWRLRPTSGLTSRSSVSSSYRAGPTASTWSSPRFSSSSSKSLSYSW